MKHFQKRNKTHKKNGIPGSKTFKLTEFKKQKSKRKHLFDNVQFFIMCLFVQNK